MIFHIKSFLAGQIGDKPTVCVYSDSLVLYIVRIIYNKTDEINVIFIVKNNGSTGEIIFLFLFLALIIVGTIFLCIKIGNNTGATLAKKAVHGVKRIFADDPEKLALLNSRGILGIGSYKRSVLVSAEAKDKSGVIVKIDNQYQVHYIKAKLLSVETEISLLNYNSIDIEKSYYDSKNNWAIVYLQGNDRKFFVRETTDSNENMLQTYISDFKIPN